MKPGDLVAFRRPNFFILGDRLGVVIDVDPSDGDESFDLFTRSCRILIEGKIQDLLMAHFKVVE